MQKFVFTRQERDVLKGLGVEALILFGSRALGLARANSDYDFGVLLKDKKVLRSHEQRVEIYNALYDLLSSAINQLVNIDIVFLEDAPAELQAHVIQHGIPVYEADKKAFLDFKEYVMLLCADFEPYKNLFHGAILSRIPYI